MWTWSLLNHVLDLHGDVSRRIITFNTDWRACEYPKGLGIERGRNVLLSDSNKALSVHVALLLWACETWRVCAWINSVVSLWCRSMPPHSAAIHGISYLNRGCCYHTLRIECVLSPMYVYYDLPVNHQWNTATGICFGWQHPCLATTQDCLRMINHTKDYILYIWYKSRGVNLNSNV